ncbi:MAG: hypothetical protein PHY02_03005 [Phycisphaerae bacterium]|nr:hypothetical protein [Phycisphaerae bacterium]
MGKIKGFVPYFFSIFIFVSICISHAFFPSISDKMNRYPEIESFFIACSSVLATMIVLTVSLAIIPIQRAIEIFSPTVRRNYIEDIYIQSIFIGMGTFIFVSLLLPWISTQNNWKVYVQIEILAISLDLIRGHFRRISFLLEPDNAINSLSKRACSLIAGTQRIIAVSSFEALKKTPKTKWTIEALRTIELQHYKFFQKQYDFLLNTWINELEDIALRAISRSEKLTVKYAIDGMTKIACAFLDSRKANFQLYPIDLFAFGSDLDKTVNPIYEKMLNICRLAIHNKDEQSGIQAVQALSYIAVKTAELRGYHKNTAPLASFPIGYLYKCSELSYNSDLDEISWNVVNELRDISQKAPDGLALEDLHFHVLNYLSRISQKYFLLKKDHIGNRAISNMCHIARHLIERRHYDFRSFLSQFLQEIEKNILLMMLNEKPADMNAFPPYSSANDFSLGQIISIAASQIKPIEDKSWINPYHEFMELNEEVYMHFRRIAESDIYDIQSSFLSWMITDTIKNIAKVYLHIARQKLTDNPQYIEELINQVGWYQSFFWVLFSKKKEVSSDKGEDVSDAMATIGLQFANAGFNGVSDDSIEDICSVAKDYIEKTEKPEDFSIADMLVCAWQLRYFAEHKGNIQLVRKADEKIQEVIDMALKKQNNVQNAYEIRKRQLEKHLQDYNPVIIPIRSEDYLKFFIQNNKKPSENNGQTPRQE